MSDPQYSRKTLTVQVSNRYILKSQYETIKWNSLFCLGQEAGGFFCQQGALVSGVSVWHGLPVGRSGMGRCPRYQPANLCKRYKIVSKVTYTDKYKIIAKGKGLYNSMILNPTR